MLYFPLQGYRTLAHTYTGETPFSLVYAMEVVLSIEVEIPSMRVLMEPKLEEFEWVQERVDQLIFPIYKHSCMKWTPHYEGPYVVKKDFSRGDLILTTMDGKEFPLPVNSDAVKEYNVEQKEKHAKLKTWNVA